MTQTFNSNDKLYIVTRADIPAGLQAAQSCHALAEFFRQFQELSHAWQDQSNYIVLLSTTSEESLDLIRAVADNHGLRHAPFYEPDLDGQLTAVAIEPSQLTSKILSKLPLALKEAAIA